MHHLSSTHPFFCGFHFDFFSTCRVTFGSPGCKHASCHLIFTTASVSDCLTSSTTFPWHQTYIHSHSSSTYSHNMSIPHGKKKCLHPSMEHTSMPFCVICCECKLLITGTQNMCYAAGDLEMGRNNSKIIA